MTFLALILIIAGVVVWITLPLGRSPGADPLAQPDEVSELEARRRELLLALQDLDFELQTGKLSSDDHAMLRERLQAEAVAVLRSLEESRAQAEPRPRRRDAAS